MYYIIKKIFYIPLLFLIIYCSSKSKIIRTIQPINRLDIIQNQDKTLSIKTVNSDITIKYIYNNEWNNLCNSFDLDTNLFSDKIRKPPLHIFLICIQNSSRNLLTPLSFYISRKNKKYKALTIHKFKKSYHSPVYNSLNLENLFSARRLIIKKLFYELSQINYHEQSIQYNFNFILPSDKIVFIKMFKKDKNTRNNFKLNIVLKYKNIKKIIDFDLAFSEYRTD